jgi:hypothetical protein
MRALKVVVAACWILLGAGLAVSGVVEWWSWRDDPILSASSLRWWHSTGIVPGALAIGVGALVWKEIAFARLAAFLLGTVFALYVIYILLLTRPEHLVRPMLVLQILVLALSVLTAVYAVYGPRWIKGGADSN